MITKRSPSRIIVRIVKTKGKQVNLDDLTLGEVKKLKYILGAEAPKIPEDCCEESKGPHIVILQRGWVFVGNLFRIGQDYRLENAYCVRNWGATKGLGEIALNGPTDKTVLDESPQVSIHELTVVAFLQCEAKKWKSKLGQ